MGTNIRGWQLVNFFTLGYTALASDTQENGVIDKDSGSSTGSIEKLCMAH